MRQATSSRQQLHVAARRRLAVELRRAGMSYRQIAAAVPARCGPDTPPRYDERHACRDVHAVLRQLQRDTSEAAEAVRRLELERLDELTLAVWSAARAGDLQAVATVLRLMGRRARLLGLDRPIPLSPTSPAGTPLAEATGLTMDVFMGILALGQAQPAPPATRL